MRLTDQSKESRSAFGYKYRFWSSANLSPYVFPPLVTVNTNSAPSIMLSATQAAVLALSFTLTSAVDVTFFSSEECDSGALYGGKINSTIPCYRLDKHLDIAPPNSTTIRNVIAGQTIHFYSDTNCQQEVFNTTTDLCYTHSENTIRSFQVSQSAEGTTALATVGSQSDFAMTNYYGVVPAKVDLDSSTIITGALIAVLASQASDIVTLAAGCLTAAGNPLGIASCAIGIVSTIIVLSAAGIIHKQVTQERARFQARLGNLVALGPGERKRDLIEGINAINEGYMATMMNVSAIGGVHVGYHERDIGNGVVQTSPVWEFNQNGTSHRLSAFYDHRSDDFVHTLHFGESAGVEKRQDTSYDDERWKAGGFDFKTCTYNSDADMSVLQADTNTLYAEVDQDLTCLLDPNDVMNGDGFAVSLMNGENVLLAQVFGTTYNADGDATSINDYGTCGTITNTPTDQSCQF